MLPLFLLLNKSFRKRKREGGEEEGEKEGQKGERRVKDAASLHLHGPRK